MQYKRYAPKCQIMCTPTMSPNGLVKTDRQILQAEQEAEKVEEVNSFQGARG